MATPERGVILIVDDEAAVRRSLEEALRPFGVDVRLVASGEEALEILADRRVLLVLLDLTLPGIDGLAVLEKLERDQGAIPVIVLADDPTAEAVAEARAHGAAAVLEKPTSQGRARAVVRDHLPTGDRGTEHGDPRDSWDGRE